MIPIKYKIFGDTFGHQIIRRFTKHSYVRDFVRWFVTKKNMKVHSVWDEILNTRLALSTCFTTIWQSDSFNMLVIPEQIQLIMCWRERAIHNRISVFVKTHGKIKEIVSEFLTKHRKQLEFQKLHGQNTKHGTSRLSNFVSIKNERLYTFRNLTGQLTIQFKMPGQASKQITRTCACGNALVWFADVYTHQVLKNAKRICQSCGISWDKKFEDPNTILYCVSGMCRVHPGGFFVCTRCSTSVCFSVYPLQ